ncbi:hypothetical protein ACJX0J_029114, partial [Zea mays]
SLPEYMHNNSFAWIFFLRAFGRTGTCGMTKIKRNLYNEQTLIICCSLSIDTLLLLLWWLNLCQILNILVPFLPPRMSHYCPTAYYSRLDDLFAGATFSSAATWQTGRMRYMFRRLPNKNISVAVHLC